MNNNWDRVYGTVAYVTDRIQKRVDAGYGRSTAVMETLATVDEDLYIKVLKDGAHGDRADLFDLYMINYYSNIKCPSFKEIK